MALILQIETATSVCSVALAQDGILLACKELNEANIHAASITLFIQDVMKNAGKNYDQLDAVAVSKGPGSYTGLRIGVSTAKGLCFALNIPLIAVDTLQTMTAGIIHRVSKTEKTLFCPMIDARRMEVYTALYDINLQEEQTVQALILDESSFDNYLDKYKLIFFGTGAEKSKLLYEGQTNAQFMEFENSASHMTDLALMKFRKNEFENTAYFEPFYLKDFLITQSAKNQ